MSPRRPLATLGAAAALALVALPWLAASVAATNVANDAEFRAAWANPAETLITLTADVTVDCTAGSLTRNSATAIVVDGAGHTLHNPCPVIALSNGPGAVTLRNLTLTGVATSGMGLYTFGDVTVENSTITGHGNVGLFLESGNATITGSTSSNNRLGVLASGAISASGSTFSNNAISGLDAGGNVTVTGSTVSGNGDGSGNNCASGIDAAGTVTVTGSTISGNDDFGIEADGAVSVASSTVADNGAIDECGDDGIRANQSASATVTGSAVTNNGGSGVVGFDVTVTGSTVAANAEFGVWSNGGQAALTNSTILGNGAVGIVGYAISARHVTISGNGLNIESWDPLDIRPTPPTLRLFATVLIDPTGGQNCLEETVIDDGFNFIDDASCGLIPASLADPQLGALGNNGGATQTRLPADLSPLVDAIPTASCGAGITTDQRGVSRPQASGCDIGSVEVALPGASITDVTVIEGNAGTVNAVFTVTLSRATTRTVTMAFATADGTATAPADFESASGSLTFAPGDSSETITVRVAGDTLDEPNETFVVNLSAPSAATLADAQGTGTIVDDDSPSAALLPDTATPGGGGLLSAPAALMLLVLLSASVSALERARRRTASRAR